MSITKLEVNDVNLAAALERYNAAKKRTWVVCDVATPDEHMPALRVSPKENPSEAKYLVFNVAHCDWEWFEYASTNVSRLNTLRNSEVTLRDVIAILDAKMRNSVDVCNSLQFGIIPGVSKDESVDDMLDRMVDAMGNALDIAHAMCEQRKKES